MERALKNSHALANIVLDLQVEFTAGQVRALREFYREMFDKPPAASEGKGLGKEAGEAITLLVKELAALEERGREYPFVAAVTPVIAKLRGAEGKPYGWYFTDLPKVEDALLDAKEQVIDPLRRFMGGAQRKIYDEAREFLSQHADNLNYVSGGDPAAIQSALADPACFKGASIQQVKAQLDAVRQQIDRLVSAERQAAIGEIEQRIGHIEGAAKKSGLDGVPPGVQRTCDDALAAVRTATLVAVIRERTAHFTSTTYPDLLGKLESVAPLPVTYPGPDEEAPKLESKVGEAPSGGFAGSKPAAPKVEYVSSSNLKVNFRSPYLADESDVEAYLETYRETLLAEIRSGKRITV